MQKLIRQEEIGIGRYLVVDCTQSDQEENEIFEKIVKILEINSNFKKHEIENNPIISVAEIEINTESRSVYCNKKEIQLTTKEYCLLILLVLNKGRVMTYEQIYRNVWGDYNQDIESNSIGARVCSLRSKLNEATVAPGFRIRCVREVGYCFEEINNTNKI